jgi:hypothetical protein
MPGRVRHEVMIRMQKSGRKHARQNSTRGDDQNAEEWKKACQAEYDTLMGYHTWTLVENHLMSM